VLNASKARRLLHAAADIHYVDRDWPAVLARVAPHGFTEWLSTGAVQRKRIDALACMTAALSSIQVPVRPPRFVRTAFVDALAREVGVDLGPAMG
jgi:hypothetical protein